MINKIKFDSIPDEKLQPFQTDDNDGFLRVAVEHSDAIIKGSDNLSEKTTKLIDNLNVPVLDYQPIEDFKEAYSNFYLNKVL